MFDPMFAGDPFLRDVLAAAPWAVGLLGLFIGFCWIYRITKDIEDN